MQNVNRLAPVEVQPESLPPTWETHIVIPIVQNILGGLAVGGLGMIGVIAYTGAFDTLLDLYNAAVWCALAGGVVACSITVIRFFGDDLGIVTAAYQAGQQSRSAQIAALELELRASYDAQSAAEANGGAMSAINKRQELMQRARRDCERIVAVAFQNDNTSRDAMKDRGMGQRDWERAIRLLMAAGVMNGEGALVATSPRQALAAVDERLSIDSQPGDSFIPKWQ